jgi:aminopeptidase
MEMIEKQKEAYARLILSQGVSLQPGQALAIKCEIAHREFVHLLARIAYQMGARFVEIDWLDYRLDRLRLEHSHPDHLEYVPDYVAQRGEERLETNWATISITGREDPDVFDGVDSTAMQRMQSAARVKQKSWFGGVMANRIAWCVCAVPTPAWAQRVFPDLPEAAAVEQLWAAILSASRADGADPVVEWQAHLHRLRSVVDFLHHHQVQTLHFVDHELAADGRPRTDLTIGLTDRPRWLSVGDQAQTGVTFSANIPSEETFSTPHRARTEGWVRTSMPFFALEQKVEDAYFRFEQGELVEFQARQGQEVLEEFFKVPGTRHLGEIALVDVTSPIYQSGLIFYNTLFDENAACHIAFGKAYPGGVQGSQSMSEEELAAFGVNDSPLHQDIMFGSPTMQITGITADGSQVTIMEEGRFADEVMAKQ